MKKLYILLFAILISVVTFGQPVINEVDADTPGIDTAEFIEILWTANTSLNGYVIVLFNGTEQFTACSLSELTLTTKDNQIEGFKFSPNSTSLGYINISSKSQTAMNVGVFDVLGKQVINTTVNNNRLDVSTLSSGIYIMKISQDNASSTKKLVIK